MSRILERWNELSAEDAAQAILPCCGTQVWARKLAARRPVMDKSSLLSASDEIWNQLDVNDWMEAFSKHPRIGEQNALRSALRQSAAWSAQEQKGVEAAGQAVQAALSAANQEYERRFGRIFIVCATGRSASEILDTLQRRLQNDSATELREAAEEQRKITNIRLEKWLSMKRISTHILDLNLGKPAGNVPVRLERREAGVWRLLTAACTDYDGRCGQLLPSDELPAGQYRLVFDTAAYFSAEKVDSLFPIIEVAFLVRDGESQFHIPLLLSANGYTTYRGS